MCDNGYNNETVPYLDDTKVGRYLCNKHVLLAHAKAYRIYEREYKPRYHGEWIMKLVTVLKNIGTLYRIVVESNYLHIKGWDFWKDMEEVIA